MKPRNRITNSVGWVTVPDTNHSEMEFLTTIGDKDIYLRPSVHSHGRSEFFVVGEDETPRYLENISSWAVSGPALLVLKERASLTKEISAFLRFYALMTVRNFGAGASVTWSDTKEGRKRAEIKVQQRIWSAFLLYQKSPAVRLYAAMAQGT